MSNSFLIVELHSTKNKLANVPTENVGEIRIEWGRALTYTSPYQTAFAARRHAAYHSVTII